MSKSEKKGRLVKYICRHVANGKSLTYPGWVYEKAKPSNACIKFGHFYLPLVHLHIDMTLRGTPGLDSSAT
jgi:hypothetical protein